MLRLEIDIEHAQLGLVIRRPKTTLSIPKPSANVETEPPAVYVEIDFPRVDIDSREAFGDIGLKQHLPLGRDQARRAREKGLDAIARIAVDGDALAAIEHGVRVAEIAAMRAWPEDDRVLNVDAIPKTPPQVTVEGGLDIAAKWGYAKTNWRNEWIGVHLDWGNVRTYLRREPNIEIQAVGNRFSILV